MSTSTFTKTLTPAGAAGAAAADESVGVPTGKLVGVEIDYTSQPATTDVTITNRGRTLLARSNANADAFVQPVVNVVDTAGAAVPATENRWAPAVVSGSVRIQVAQGDPVADGVKVTLVLEVG